MGLVLLHASTQVTHAAMHAATHALPHALFLYGEKLTRMLTESWETVRIE
jgi:hypothetical protein